MYKVFFNSRYIFLGKTPLQSDTKNIKTILFDSQERTIKQLVETFRSNRTKILQIITSSPESLMIQLKMLFRVIQAAGGLVKNNKNQILAIKMRNVWDFPKGWIDPGETPEEAAIREVREECGIQNIRIKKYLNNSFHTYILNNEIVLKEIFWYEMEASGNEELIPQTEELITEVKWFHDNEIEYLINHTYPSIKELIVQNRSNK